MAEGIGKIVEIIGPVVDIRFDDGHLPSIFNAIHIKHENRTLVTEVMQHVGGDVVRTIAMDTTERQ